MNLINVSSLSGGMFNQMVRLGNQNWVPLRGGVSGMSIEKDQAGEDSRRLTRKAGEFDRLSEPTGYVHYNFR